MKDAPRRPKLNCWDAKQCGREAGGARVHELGVCPAFTLTAADGINGGRNAGRICWAVTGTFCGAEVRGCEAKQHLSCMTCEFYKHVMQEEMHNDYRLLLPGQEYHRRIS